MKRGEFLTRVVSGAMAASTASAMSDETTDTCDQDQIPELKGHSEKAGTLRLAPASITFLAFPDAGNPGCR